MNMINAQEDMVVVKSTAPGKIILTGEYAVVFGYPGIAVPSPLSMTVTLEEDDSGSLTISLRTRRA